MRFNTSPAGHEPAGAAGGTGRRRSLRGPSIVLILAAAILSGACQAPGEKTPPRADVILITVDSLRADRPGFMGGDLATPGMDWVAADGWVFETALSPVPQTLPSMVSIHTGLYPPSHGVRNDGLERLGDAKPTLAALFGEAGYRTAAFAGALALHPKYGLDRGFDLYAEAFADIPRPRTSPVQGIPAPRITEKAIEWLGGIQDGERYFLWVNYFDPHYFYEPPSPFKERFEESPYDGEVALVDQEIGKLLDWIRDHQRDQTTVIALAGNHGEGLGDAGEKYHGILLNDATVRTPLAIRPAGGAGEQIRIPAPVSLVDAAPTILALAGLPAGGGFDGRDLSELAGPEPAGAPRPVYFETMLPATAFGWAPLRGIRDGSLKYVEAAGTGWARLFDVGADPAEEKDLREEKPAEAERLAKLVRETGGSSGIAPVPLPDPLREVVASLGLSDAPPPERTLIPAEMVETGNAALQAHRSFRRKMMRAAAFLIQEVYDQDSGNYLALVDGASIQMNSQQVPAAQQLLRQAQELYPADGEVYHLMGHLAILQATGMEDIARARKLFETAVRLAPLNEEALYDLACATSGENPEIALNYLEQAIQNGFRDYKHMAIDGDLNPIRDNPRFARITGGNVPEPPPMPSGSGQPQPPAPGEGG